MDGNGSRDDTGWISKQDGFLVMDLDGDGRITSPAELSLLGLKADAKSGLAALAALDTKADGVIDASDSRFGELKLWIDSNGNGVTDAGELKSLADYGIASIGPSARAAAEAKVKIGQNALVATSTFTRTDESMGSVGDAALAFRAGSAPGALVGSIAAALGDKKVPAALEANVVEAPSALEDQLTAMRAGLNTRPLLPAAADGWLFDRDAGQYEPGKEDVTAGRMDIPHMAVLASDEASTAAASAD
jgi:hypothetical protein